jgi:hypothetical protein
MQHFRAPLWGGMARVSLLELFKRALWCRLRLHGCLVGQRAIAPGFKMKAIPEETTRISTRRYIMAAQNDRSSR